MLQRQSSISARIRRLADLSRRFGPQAAADKTQLVRALRSTRLTNPDDLLLLHDTLCFMRAYPDSSELENLVETELQRFEARVRGYRRSTRDKSAARLADSGIAGTKTTHPFGYEMALLLKERHGKSIKLERDDNLSEWEDKLYDVLPLLVAWQENDAIDNDDSFDVEGFLKRARGERSSDDLQGLLHLFRSAELNQRLRRHFFESLDLYLSWNLAASRGSRTLCRFPSASRFYFAEPLLPRSGDLAAQLKAPAKRLVRLSRSEGKEIISLACEVLAVRNRELYPITLANPEEIYCIEPGRGLQIYLFATPPSIRLPLEANFGAMFARNGMPIGYGIAATLFDRVEIAINVFPAYRAGESAYIIEQFFKVFYHHFGSRIFLVRSMQMGNDEEEALKSGAFWFYYKLGFRAISPAVRKLAEQERAKQLQRRGYRTPLKTQEKLAKSDVVLVLDDAQRGSWKEPPLARLAYRVTDYFAQSHDGDREAGIEAALSELTTILAVRSFKGWSEGEVTSLKRLAPLLINIKGLPRWSAREKRDLVSVIRAKGSRYERDYALLSLKHKKLKRAIEILAGIEPNR